MKYKCVMLGSLAVKRLHMTSYIQDWNSSDVRKRKRAANISADNTHLGHKLFRPLPSPEYWVVLQSAICKNQLPLSQ